MLSYEEIMVIKNTYNSGGNVIQYIREHCHSNLNEAILFSYDLQAGTYTVALRNDSYRELKILLGKKLAHILNDLNVKQICEAGVGEATTLVQVMNYSGIEDIYAFDISLSRLFYAKSLLQKQQLHANLFCAELANLPFENDSIECICTIHSIEPNGGIEDVILKELLRVSRKYLVLVEPDYDMFSDAQRERMDAHGYCKSLKERLGSCDVDVVKYEALGLDSNPLNKASIIVAKKKRNISYPISHAGYVSPISRMPLTRVTEGYFCNDDGFLFPVIQDIPDFLASDAILVSHYNNFLRE